MARPSEKRQGKETEAGDASAAAVQGDAARTGRSRSQPASLVPNSLCIPPSAAS